LKRLESIGVLAFDNYITGLFLARPVT